jgi:hypothetical protein
MTMASFTPNEDRLAPEFDRAMGMRDNGELAAALEFLRSLIERLNPDDQRLLTHSHLQCGHICTMLGDARGREEHFRAAVTIAPRMELASLAWFYSLFGSGRTEAALEEMVRFLLERDSPEYRELLSGDGYRDDLPPMQRTLANEAPRLVEQHARKC